MVETFTQQMQAQAGSTPESSPVPGMQQNQEGGVIVFGTNFEVGRTERSENQESEVRLPTESTKQKINDASLIHLNDSQKIPTENTSITEQAARIEGALARGRSGRKHERINSMTSVTSSQRKVSYFILSKSPREDRGSVTSNQNQETNVSAQIQTGLQNAINANSSEHRRPSQTVLSDSNKSLIDALN